MAIHHSGGASSMAAATMALTTFLGKAKLNTLGTGP